MQYICGGPAEHHFGAVVRKGTWSYQAALSEDPENVQEVAMARSYVFPWAYERQPIIR